jgi:hypothetical protein
MTHFECTVQEIYVITNESIQQYKKKQLNRPFHLIHPPHQLAQNLGKRVPKVSSENHQWSISFFHVVHRRTGITRLLNKRNTKYIHRHKRSVKMLVKV